MISLLPLQPHNEEGPVFQEPWEAQAFALAVELSRLGLFTWPEWTEIFSKEIAAAQAAGDPDLGDTYYHHWARALEKLIASKGGINDAAISERAEAWRRAYLNTPHGQPIELTAAQKTLSAPG
ncbi:MAG: nitrile hydratase accessory protein [Rhodospirillales bacterium]|nr:nitrile hydratase accessory protein [Rhodospirillales bacterium]